MKRRALPFRIPQRSPLHAVAHLSALGMRVLIYGPLHDLNNITPDNSPVAEGHGHFTLSEGSLPDPAALTAALRSACADLPGPIDTLALIIPAAQCRLAQRPFPAGLCDAEAHALAAQMASQIATELGHNGPVAFDWRSVAANEIVLCVAPRALITDYLEAVHAIGMRCTAITPEDESPHAGNAPTPFNLLPWRNAVWLRRGQNRLLGLLAATLLVMVAVAWIAADQATHEQAINAQLARAAEAIKARQDQLPDLAKLRQQLADQQAKALAARQAQESTAQQQQALATQLDHLARTRPREIRYRNLSADAQGMKFEGLAQTPASITQLLKGLPCPRLSEGRRDEHGRLRFAVQIPPTCEAPS